MMQVGIVRVLVPRRRVFMPMSVRLARRIVRTVSVLVMQVMDVPMGVSQCAMDVLVFVPFRQVQPKPDRHQNARAQQAD